MNEARFRFFVRIFCFAIMLLLVGSGCARKRMLQPIEAQSEQYDLQWSDVNLRARTSQQIMPPEKIALLQKELEPSLVFLMKICSLQAADIMIEEAVVSMGNNKWDLSARVKVNNFTPNQNSESPRQSFKGDKVSFSEMFQNEEVTLELISVQLIGKFSNGAMGRGDIGRK